MEAMDREAEGDRVPEPEAEVHPEAEFEKEEEEEGLGVEDRHRVGELDLEAMDLETEGDPLPEREEVTHAVTEEDMELLLGRAVLVGVGDLDTLFKEVMVLVADAHLLSDKLMLSTVE